MNYDLFIHRRGAEARVNLRQVRRWFADDATGSQASDKAGANSGGTASETTATDNKHSDWFNSLPKEAQAAIVAEREEAKKYRLKLRKLEKEMGDGAKQKAAQDDQKMLEGKQYEELLKKREQRIAELEKAAADREAQSLREKIARKHGLPDEFADRLRGDTEEELNEDAEKVAKLVVKPDDKGKKTSTTTTANPGGKPSETTYDQLKSRRYGGNKDFNPFSPG